MRELLLIHELILKFLYSLIIAHSGGLKLLYSLVKPLYILATCLYECLTVSSNDDCGSGCGT
jgi:hypothetical protein